MSAGKPKNNSLQSNLQQDEMDISTEFSTNDFVCV